MNAVKQHINRQWAFKQIANWLFHKLGEKPVKQRLIDETEVSWPFEEQPVKIFLIHYRMRNGLEGIGITGPITWSFLGLDDWTQLTPEDWVYCYVGWFIQFFFINSQTYLQINNKEKAESFVSDLIKQGIIEAQFYRICDVLQLGEDLTYYAIEAICQGEQVYLVGTQENYIFYNKDFPPMQLPPLLYFLGKTFNPFSRG
jgi:hypothetical protein